MTAPLDQVRASISRVLPRLRRFAHTITLDRDDADDLVQIAIERALERHEEWRPESRFEGWMLGVVCVAWMDDARARRRRHRELAAGKADGSADALGELPIRTAMAALPEEQRMAIALVLIEGLSYKEAAEALELPIGALMSQLARAREVLQTVL
jgi:RNA polymerase sigma-70 factor, ECF subfamily